MPIFATGPIERGLSHLGAIKKHYSVLFGALFRKSESDLPTLGKARCLYGTTAAWQVECCLPDIGSLSRVLIL